VRRGTHATQATEQKPHCGAPARAVAQTHIWENVMIIRGSARPETLNGLPEDDTIFGFGADDQLFGNDGDDHLFGGEGADVLNGGNGRDWASYDDAAAGVYVVLITGAGYGGEAAGDTLISIENLSGSAFGDVLISDDGINYINGNGGNDLIFGLDGIDVLYGGDGDDQIWGGAARDYIYGDDGFDYVRYDYATSAVDVRLDMPSFIGTGGGWAGEAAFDSFFSIEGVVGSLYDDHIAGNAEANVLIGLDGNDELLGRDGDDQLFGGSGADVIDGGTGFNYARYDDATSAVVVDLSTGWGTAGDALNDHLINIQGLTGSSFGDTLIGNAANNILFGFEGSDNLQGGGGTDFLLGGNGDDILNGGAGGDYLQGDLGFDVASYAGAVSSIGVNLASGAGTFGEALGDVLVGIDGVIGSAFADTLTGDANANMLRGAEGADSLTGGLGDDQFVFARNDLLAERDTINDFGVVAGNNDMLVFHGIASGDVALTDVSGGVRISVLDPAFGGDIMVSGVTSAQLGGHLLFA
jgi:Ca2+-binding RTX toxin-like protein